MKPPGPVSGSEEDDEFWRAPDAEESGEDDEDDPLWREFMQAVMHDDGAAAKEHLEAGFPIYYAHDDTPPGLLIKEHPDGRRELVIFDRDGDGDIVVKTL